MDRLRAAVVGTEESEEAWRRAIPSIRNTGECPAYGGLEITKQLGLVPIGRDPASRLWEFANILTGTAPRRGDNGKLELTDETGVVLVLLPGGKFTMGSPSSEEGRQEDEGPLHEVALSPFFISKYEVRQEEWERVIGSRSALFEGHNLPVESVNWNECRAFCTSCGLSLPSEAQWEYACRAGTTGPYGGTGQLDDMGWYDKNASGKTYPVGLKRPNDFGLHDMHGNVFEWCHDAYDGDWYSKPEASGHDPVSAAGSGNRVRRGGSWTAGASGCRSGFRYSSQPWARFDFVGLRLARPVLP